MKYLADPGMDERRRPLPHRLLARPGSGEMLASPSCGLFPALPVLGAPVISRPEIRASAITGHRRSEPNGVIVPRS